MDKDRKDSEAETEEFSDEDLIEKKPNLALLMEQYLDGTLEMEDLDLEIADADLDLEPIGKADFLDLLGIPPEEAKDKEEVKEEEEAEPEPENPEKLGKLPEAKAPRGPLYVEGDTNILFHDIDIADWPDPDLVNDDAYFLRKAAEESRAKARKAKEEAERRARALKAKQEEERRARELLEKTKADSSEENTTESGGIPEAMTTEADNMSAAIIEELVSQENFVAAEEKKESESTEEDFHPENNESQLSPESGKEDSKPENEGAESPPESGKVELNPEKKESESDSNSKDEELELDSEPEKEGAESKPESGKEEPDPEKEESDPETGKEEPNPNPEPDKEESNPESEKKDSNPNPEPEKEPADTVKENLQEKEPTDTAEENPQPEVIRETEEKNPAEAGEVEEKETAADPEKEKPAEKEIMAETSEQKKETEDSINEKKDTKAMIKEIASWVIPCLIAVAIVLLVKTYVIIQAKIPSGSMENTIMTHDQLIGNRLAYLNKDPERGDIVIFYYPDDESQKFIKRIIGLPGETVLIEDGKIYINGSETPLEEDYLKEEWVIATGPYEFEIPEDCYLMLGDNRNNSKDARYWTNTYVTRDKIIGKAMWIYFPFSHWGSLND